MGVMSDSLVTADHQVSLEPALLQHQWSLVSPRSRHTFSFEAKISWFWKKLGIYVFVERNLDTSLTYLSFRKATRAIRKIEKASIEHAGSVRLVSYSAVVTILT